MSVADQVWIGADPGGKGNFGLAILESNGSASTYCVGCTETHPKAVWKALKMKNGSAFVKHYAVRAEIRDDQEHESDAIISAVAAREGFEGRWLNDLGRTRHPSEQDPSTYWLA